MRTETILIQSNLNNKYLLMPPARVSLCFATAAMCRPKHVAASLSIFFFSNKTSRVRHCLLRSTFEMELIKTSPTESAIAQTKVRRTDRNNPVGFEQKNHSERLQRHAGLKYITYTQCCWWTVSGRSMAPRDKPHLAKIYYLYAFDSSLHPSLIQSLMIKSSS